MIPKDFTYSIRWNMFQICLGSLIYAVALKGIAVPHTFIPGGLFGAASLLYYVSDTLQIGVWYLLFNIPLFVFAWRGISKRFLWYSLASMLIFTFFFSVIEVDFGIHDQLYAAIASGFLCGLGGGIVLRSLGSNGGLDVVGIWLYQKYNIGLGKFYFVFNTLLYCLSLLYFDVDLVIASVIMVFCTSFALEYALSLFSQRKMVFIISDFSDQIAKSVQEHLKIGGTFINGTGCYSGQSKRILMTVINNVQLKRLEEAVFTIDPKALFIAENTFTVLGMGFSKRKIY